MNNFFFSIFGIFLFINTFVSYGQDMVSKEVQKRNIILEEFTGIHCGYCPDGHRIANEFVESNPGRVFLINIHAGGYANPSNGSEVDLRTVEGAAIDGAAQVSGYPAGTINRSTTPWAKGRYEWAPIVSSILQQNSPVNVAVKSYVDFETREVVTEVEYYYTSTVTGPNYLTVMLTQDNVLGTQSDYGNYNPDNWTPTKEYRHNHVLRQALTSGGPFGEKIDITTKDSYEKRIYKTTLPTDYKNTKCVLYNLNVVAFVSQGQNNIYSGAGAKVDFDQALLVDLELNDKTEYPKGYCITKINPVTEVINHSGTDINGFDITMLLHGNPNTKKFTGTLAKGESTTIEWGEIPFTATGEFEVITYGFKNINGGNSQDMIWENDLSRFSSFSFKQNAFSDYLAGFDGYLPQNMALDKSRNRSFDMISSTSTKYGANNTTGAIRFPLHSSWGVAGLPGDVLFGEADLSKLSKPSLDYYYAYSDDNFGGTKPEIKASVSEDCGETWIEVSSVLCDETGKPSVAGNWYVPKTTDYKLIQIPLTAFAGKSVLFKMTGIPGSAGNALYIDEMRIGNALVGVEEEIINNSYSVYPNPTVDELNFSDASYNENDFSIISLLGEQVLSGKITNNSVNVSNLSTGVYFIRVNNNIFRFVKN